MKKTKSTKLFVALLVVCMMTTSVIGGTLAAYTSNVDGSGTLTVAKWDVSFGTYDSNDTFTSTTTVDLGALKEANDLVTAGKIAPGDKGSFKVAVDPGDTEVKFTYTVAIEDVELPIKFYKEEACTNEFTTTDAKTVEIGGATDSLEIFWKWDTTGNTADDTEVGEAATGDALNFDITITATQVVAS